MISLSSCNCSVAILCLILCDSVECSTPGFPVLHYLLEFVPGHIHWVSDAINHLTLCRPFLLLPSVFLSIRVFSNELALHVRWPKYWSFSFSISPSIECSGLISHWNLKNNKADRKTRVKTSREKISFNIYFDWGNNQRSLVMRWGAGVYQFRKVTRRDLFFCLLHTTSVICIFFFSKWKSHSLPSLTLHLCCHSCGHVEKMTSL